MENKLMKKIDKVMHFLIHNGFLFTVIVMCLVHVTLLGIFSFAGVQPLAQFNILSVIVYVFSILFCKYGKIMPVYVSIILEVTIYTIYSTHYIGLRCGTYCFLFSIVPIIIYFGAFLFKGRGEKLCLQGKKGPGNKGGWVFSTAAVTRGQKKGEIRYQ